MGWGSQDAGVRLQRWQYDRDEQLFGGRPLGRNIKGPLYVYGYTVARTFLTLVDRGNV